MPRLSRAPIAVAVACVALVLTGPVPALAQSAPLTGAQIVALPAQADGSTVLLEGEAIGDVMRGRGGQWVNVLSGGTAVGVWLTGDSAATLQTLGDYHEFGDTVRVRGVLNQGCDEHGGDLDIHATDFEIVAPGGPREHTLHPYKLPVAAALGLVAIAQLLLYRRQRRRML